MTTTKKSTDATQAPAYVEYFQREKTGVPILIWSETKAGADEIDSLIQELLKEYGFDLSAPVARREFAGSHFVLYSSTNDFSEVAADVSRKLAGEPLRKDVGPKKYELLSKLKEKIEKGTGFLVLAGALFGAVAALHEAYENYLKAFSVPRPPAVTMVSTPLSGIGKSIGKTDNFSLEVIPLPAAFGPLIENAEKHPDKFELVMMFVIANHIETTAPPQGAIHHRRKHRCKPSAKPSPLPRGNLGTL